MPLPFAAVCRVAFGCIRERWEQGVRTFRRPFFGVEKFPTWGPGKARKTLHRETSRNSRNSPPGDLKILPKLPARGPHETHETPPKGPPEIPETARRAARQNWQNSPRGDLTKITKLAPLRAGDSLFRSLARDTGYDFA